MSPWFFRSLFFHFSLILSVYVLNFSIGKFRDIGKKEKIVVAPSSIRVDVVAMPTLTLREQRQMALASLKAKSEAPPTESQKISPPSPKAPPAETKSTSDLELEKVEKEKKLSDLLKDFSDRPLDSGKNKKTEDSKKENPSKGPSKWASSTADEMKNLLLAGNKLSKGIGLEGPNQNHDVSDFHMYLEQLVVHIRPFWKLPGYLVEQNLKCRIRLFLSQHGDLNEVLLYESSGLNQYDEKALEAIKMAAPFPAPPESIRDRVKEGEIILGFPI